MGTIIIVLMVALIVLVAIAFRLIREQIKDHRRLEVTYDGSLEYDKMNEYIKGVFVVVLIIIALMVGMCESAKAGNRIGLSNFEQRQMDSHAKVVIERMGIKSPVKIRGFKSTKNHANKNVGELRGYTVQSGDTIEIYLSMRLDLEEMHETISHELVHVWQFDRGRLRALRNGWVFDGEFYPIDTPYRELKHEQEAFVMSKKEYFNN